MQTKIWKYMEFHKAIIITIISFNKNEFLSEKQNFFITKLFITNFLLKFVK